MHYGGVIFDLDGVIADTARFHYEAWKKLADELGIYFDKKTNERLKGIGRMESLDIILENSNISYTLEQKKYYAEKKNEYYKQFIQTLTPDDVLPGVKELMEILKRKGIKTAVASASKNAPTVLNKLGIASEFDYIVDASRIRKGKPDPELFLTAAINIGVEPSECIGIEDSAAGIEAIKRAGMFAVGVGDPKILKKADMVLKDLKDYGKIVDIISENITINNDRIFIVTDGKGNIKEDRYGLFYKDTRFLSKYDLEIDGKKPKLSKITSEKNFSKEISIEYKEDDNDRILQMYRKSFIYENTFYESFVLKNCGLKTEISNVTLDLNADFKDIFDVRGFAGGIYGSKPGVQREARQVVFEYTGLDGVLRKTTVQFNQDARYEKNKVVFMAELPPNKVFTFEVHVNVTVGNEKKATTLDFYEGLKTVEKSFNEWSMECAEVITDNERFNSLYKRSIEDLRSLLLNYEGYRIPAAGIPWFAVPFGRDSIVCAVQSLMINPGIARDVLLLAAKYQGLKLDGRSEEEPGKIFHEIREGEFTNTGMVPFGPYYGTHDATPLFLVLLHKYYKWTGDIEFLRKMLPAAEKALEWVISYGDRDNDGFLEYMRADEKGFTNQGWKDSEDSVRASDGKIASPPIALAEIQGYAYDAYMGMAELYKILKDTDPGNIKDKVEALKNKAAALRRNFHKAFWMEDKKYFAEALDRNKRQVDSITSNPGHCLWSGIIDGVYAKYVADRLISPEMFSGWGIRTMSSKEAAYDPESYHNGSVWPHDNSLIALGFSRYGFWEHLKVVFDALLEASAGFHGRLPELFCGYDKRERPLTQYPVACSPQAWAAASPFALLEAILGIRVDAQKGIVSLDPTLPDSINHITVKRMRVGEKLYDFEVERKNGKVEYSFKKGA